MNTLHKILEDALDGILSEFEEPISEEQLTSLCERALNSTLSRISDDVLGTLKESATEVLSEARSASEQFTRRNIERWSRGFDLLEMLIAICTEAGDMFNSSHRPHAAARQDVVFDVAVRMHARTCHIASEILCLLKNGYADGAHARWRSLHEAVATAFFIVKHGRQAATRFLEHEVIECYKGMRQHDLYAERLKLDPFSAAEREACKSAYNSMLTRYGKTFQTPYGWASPFLGNSKPSFADIEKDVDLDHMRPYYKWASQNVHANVKSIRSSLGLSEAREDILLVGQSNSGMTDPAHATAISLSQATAALLNIEPNADSIVTLRLILTLTDEVGEAFLDADQKSLTQHGDAEG